MSKAQENYDNLGFTAALDEAKNLHGIARTRYAQGVVDALVNEACDAQSQAVFLDETIDDNSSVYEYDARVDAHSEVNRCVARLQAARETASDTCIAAMLDDAADTLRRTGIDVDMPASHFVTDMEPEEPMSAHDCAESLDMLVDGATIRYASDAVPSPQEFTNEWRDELVAGVRDLNDFLDDRLSELGRALSSKASETGLRSKTLETGSEADFDYAATQLKKSMDTMKMSSNTANLALEYQGALSRIDKIVDREGRLGERVQADAAKVAGASKATPVPTLADEPAAAGTDAPTHDGPEQD